MFKRFTRLSLIKQCLIIIVIISVLFAAILVPLIDYNLNSIVDEQMYDTLYESQINISSSTSYADKKVRAVKHLLYNVSENEIKCLSMEYDKDTPSYLYNYVFGTDLKSIINSEDSSLKNKKEVSDKSYYYLISKLNDDYYIISLTTSDYSSDLISSLRNQIVYIQYIFVIAIALIIMLWVISLINPLKKIKNYIDSIKNNQDYSLNINRQDEIGQISLALKEMKKELDLQESIKEEMIHNISHDLKTPIALIKTYSESVKDDIYPYGDKNSSMDIIIENADRLDHKVKSFLYLNRLDYLQGENKEVKPFEIKETIEKVAKQLSLVHPNLNIELDLENICFVGEEEHWRVAIENIVENASRYANTVIKITLNKEGLEVFNDGEHIDEEKMEYLFKPYVKGVKGQFGLGLSIVEKTANMYGYDVKAYNLDNGVSFKFTKKN